MRGRGWLTNFSIGNVAPDRGVPLASVFRWDTGVQVHAESDVVDATASVTAGTISNPLFKDDNGGRQFAGRVVLHPAVGLIVGASASRGGSSRDRGAGRSGRRHDGDFPQTAWGGDIGLSRGYYVVRFESYPQPVDAADGSRAVPRRSIERARHLAGGTLQNPSRACPAAAQLDHLGFSEVAGTRVRTTWDAPVTRVEVGGGYSLQRNLLLKIGSARRARRGPRAVAESHLRAAGYWF